MKGSSRLKQCSNLFPVFLCAIIFGIFSLFGVFSSPLKLDCTVADILGNGFPHNSEVLVDKYTSINISANSYFSSKYLLIKEQKLKLLNMSGVALSASHNFGSKDLSNVELHHIWSVNNLSLKWCSLNKFPSGIKASFSNCPSQSYDHKVPISLHSNNPFANLVILISKYL